MMLTHGKHFNILHYHHLIVILVKYSAIQYIYKRKNKQLILESTTFTQFSRKYTTDIILSVLSGKKKLTEGVSSIHYTLRKGTVQPFQLLIGRNNFLERCTHKEKKIERSSQKTGTRCKIRTIHCFWCNLRKASASKFRKVAKVVYNQRALNETLRSITNSTSM